MTDRALLLAVAAELADIKAMLADIIAERNISESRAKVRAEISGVVASGVDPIEYLKSKSRIHTGGKGHGKKR